MSNATTSETAKDHASTTSEVGIAETPNGLTPMLDNAATWVGVAFLIFMALLVRYLLPMITKGLDDRAEKIRDQLEQASRLRAEAHALLETYKAEQEALLKQAESIIAAAKADAAALRASAAVELKASLDRRVEQARDKIARTEAEAVNSIRNRIIETATQKTRDVLSQNTNDAADEHMIAKAITVIEQHVH